ncbi:endophilin-B1b isoform X1 [Sinocyclocheilus grahami]|uniref:endophilin-B1b isoform X1 n=1 Tax=Sinocyclocheilus grahami TaxID=75366 RepID=UPI0007AD42F0|nr:PREDICTED: endophilin-B1-like isoform X1 [Sinocyclocheilus grahami]XP_016090931.1 PREDICTED: endophilin-B1-like isoform X1 [Sinocyclocheilus grahami]XP_016090932.1 PREDICTED: endophilin-B1-like isoform X1 [Sinocyclocheilus grahami]
MEFNVRRLAADAGTFLSRAVQFTEEKFGQAEKTELDAHLDTLLSWAESTKHWTEKIMKQTEVLLQPNPNVRVEEFLYEMLDKKVPMRANNHELLGECMIDSGHEFGPGTAYGSALIKCGETEKLLGSAEKELIQSSAINFLTPFRNFIEGDFKTILKERKLLQNKRLDLDAAKNRLKKARVADARSAELNSSPPLGEEYVAHFSYMLSFLHVRWLKLWTEEVQQAETELRIAQSEFDRQAEITRLLLEGISSTHAHHLRCLNDFVDAQAIYYAQCYQYMVSLQKQLGSENAIFPSTFSNNNQQAGSSSASISVPTAQPAASLPAPPPSQASPALNELRSTSGTRKARVLYDYDAASSSELSLLADEVITVSSVPGMDTDWLMGQRGNQKGKVPFTYLELLN